jgi:hypothetical protein
MKMRKLGSVALAVLCSSSAISTDARAQSLGQLFETLGQKSAQERGSREMLPVCSSADVINAVRVNSLGYRSFRPATDLESHMVDAIAQSVGPQLNIVVNSLSWRPDVDQEGACVMSLTMTIPQEFVGGLGGSRSQTGNVEIRLKRTAEGWVIFNSFGDDGIPNNDFRSFFTPLVRAAADRKLESDRSAAAHSEEEAEAAQQRAEAEAKAAFKRDHPREWAAQQARARQRAEYQRRQELVQQANEARRAAACEAHGGTWGYRIGNPLTTPLGNRCFFEIAN